MINTPEKVSSIDAYILRAAAIHTAKLIWRCERYGWPKLSAPITISNPRANPDGGKGATGYATLLERHVILSKHVTLKIKCSRADYTHARDALSDHLRNRALEYIATDYPATGKRVIPTPHNLTPWFYIRPDLATLEFR